MSDQTPTEPKKPPTADRLLRHPLAPMLLGFLLTGVVGTLLSNHFAYQRQREAQIVAQIEGRRQAVTELSRLFAERITRAEMLVAALDRGAKKEVVERLKQLYDEAETNWLLHRQEALLLVTEVLGEKDSEMFLKELDARLAKKRLLPLRDCLDQVCDQVMAGGDAKKIMDECRLNDLVKECRPCSEAMLDELFNLASAMRLNSDARELAQVRARAVEHIVNKCP